MKRIIFIFLVCLSLNAKIIDKVVASVNGEPITSYDIQKVSQNFKMSPNEAINYLIDQKLIKSEIKQRGISIDDYEINEAMDKIARRNRLTLFEFKNILLQRGEYNKFKEKIKNDLLKQKLFASIVNSKLKITSNEIKNYYNSHKNEFSIFDTIQVVKYSSKTPENLKYLFKNPFFNNKNILSETKIYKWNELPLDKLYLFKNTKVGQYTPIINEGLEYSTYYISNKKGTVFLPFEKVKNIVANKLIEEKRNKILKEYFDRVKNRADIKFYN